jgi:hypothetical protein
MAKAMALLRKLRLTRQDKPQPETAFDRRLNRLGGVRHVSVARAVLFRTRPAHQEA